MKIGKGKYRTEAGSTVTVSGKYGGVFEIEFDRVEEKNACIDCRVQLIPEWNGENWQLNWDCDFCGGGIAILHKETDESN